jgi:RHS repeat-associated protein
VGFYIAAMLSSTATTTIDRDETEELGKALGLDFALTFLFLPRPFASASKPAEEDPPEKVLLDAKKTGSDLIKKEFDDEGKLSDGMSGMRLSYFGARYYDAEVGVWTSVDPAGQFFNPYAYSSNPIVFIDPDGRTFGAFIGQVALGAAMSGAGYALTAGDDFSGKGMAMSLIAGGIGGAASYGGAAISDALVAAGHMGAGASIITEMGVNVGLSAAGNALSQAVFIGAGWQEKFNAASLGMAAGSTLLSSSLRIARSGYLQNSTDRAKNLSPEQLARYKKYMPDPTTNRLRYYREGGLSQYAGLTRYSGHGDKFPGYPANVSVYDKDASTFVHEMSHQYLDTYDKGLTENAYGFESYVHGGPIRMRDEGGIFWINGKPVGNYSQSDYTNW